MSAKSNAAAQTVSFTAVNGAPIEVIAPAVEQVTVSAEQAAPAGPTVEQQIALAVARAEKALAEKLTAEHLAKVAQAVRESAAQAAAAQAETIRSAAQHAKTVQPEPAAASIEDMVADMAMPSAKRVLVGFILGLASAFAVGYGIGMLLSYALAGILTLTATAWIAFALTVVAWIIAIYAGWKVGGYVGGKVFCSVVLPDGLASRSYDTVSEAASSAKETVSGWFTSSKNVVAAKVNEAQTVVTGAFTKAAA